MSNLRVHRLVEALLTVANELKTELEKDGENAELLEKALAEVTGGAGGPGQQRGGCASTFTSAKC